MASSKYMLLHFSWIAFMLIHREGESITQPPLQQTKQDSPRQLFQDYWLWTLNTRPELASNLGIHIQDDSLDSHSVSNLEIKKNFYYKFLDRLHLLEPNTQNKNDKLHLKILKWELQMLLGSITFKEYHFPIDNMKGSHLSFKFISRSQKLENEKDFHNYLSRLKALAIQVEEDMELLRLGLMEGRTYHILSLQEVPAKIDQLLIQPNETIYFQPFYRKKISRSISKEMFQNFQFEALRIINEEIQPAYRKLKDFLLEEYARGLRDKISLISIPGGKSLYIYLLQKYTSTIWTPRQIHQLGLNEVSRIDKELKNIIQELGYNDTLREFSDRLRRYDWLMFHTSNEILRKARQILFNIIEPVLPKIFWKLPKSKLRVAQFPISGGIGGSGAAYIPKYSDSYDAASFMITTKPVIQIPKYELLTVCLHEGIPGHHLQISYFKENINVYNFRRNPLFTDMYSAFVEGWGLYAEYLGLELDLFQNLSDRYGHYSWENFRASRLVVDTGIHYFGWSKQKAVDFLIEHTAASLAEIRNEVDRYITMPGQACAYKIGELKIRQIRQHAEDTLGSKFDVRDFHQVVLDCGKVPIQILEHCVDEYIESKVPGKKKAML